MINIGQYYRFVNIDKKQICDRNRGLMKLTEHSYLRNDYCDDILSLLSSEWKNDRVIHVGDYAEPNDETTTQNEIEKIVNDNRLINTVYEWASSFEEVEPFDEIRAKYVYNHDKKEYIDLTKQPIQWCFSNKKKLGFAKLNSFALLTACGNGLGGGDYGGINENLIGYWAGDKLESSEKEIEKYNHYKEINNVFNEQQLYNKGLSYGNYDDDYKAIKNIEQTMFIDHLDELRKKEEDLSKLKIDTSNLTNDESKMFKEDLQNYLCQYYGKKPNKDYFER